MKPIDKKKSPLKDSKMTIDSDAVRQLAELVKENELSEIEYESSGCRIRVARNHMVAHHPTFMHPHAAPYGPQDQTAQKPTAPSSEAAPSVDQSKNTIKSPMVGTAYLSPKPGDPPFITIGSTIKEGQTLMIIEAMKVMNPLKASKSGKVADIFIEDGQPVEFDLPLLSLE